MCCKHPSWSTKRKCHCCKRTASNIICAGSLGCPHAKGGLVKGSRCLCVSSEVLVSTATHVNAARWKRKDVAVSREWEAVVWECCHAKWPGSRPSRAPEEIFWPVHASSDSINGNSLQRISPPWWQAAAASEFRIRFEAPSGKVMVSKSTHADEGADQARWEHIVASRKWEAAVWECYNARSVQKPDLPILRRSCNHHWWDVVRQAAAGAQRERSLEGGARARFRFGCLQGPWSTHPTTRTRNPSCRPPLTPLGCLST